MLALLLPACQHEWVSVYFTDTHAPGVTLNGSPGLEGPRPNLPQPVDHPAGHSAACGGWHFTRASGLLGELPGRRLDSPSGTPGPQGTSMKAKAAAQTPSWGTSPGSGHQHEGKGGRPDPEWEDIPRVLSLGDLCRHP